MKIMIILSSVLVFLTVSFTFAEEPYLIIEIPKHIDYLDTHISNGIQAIIPAMDDMVFFEKEVEGLTNVKMRNMGIPFIKKYFVPFLYVMEQKVIDSLLRNSIGKRFVNVMTPDSNNLKVMDSSNCENVKNILIFYNDQNKNLLYAFTCNYELKEFLIGLKIIINKRYAIKEKSLIDYSERIKLYSESIDMLIDWIERSNNIEQIDKGLD